MVVFCVAQEASVPHSEYIERKRENIKIFYPNFLQIPVSLHAKFEANHSSQSQDASEQNFAFVSLFFLPSSSLIHPLCTIKDGRMH